VPNCQRWLLKKINEKQNKQKNVPSKIIPGE
jgi:hypothetical protein